MKTAATVLQEMMLKLGGTPDYECIAQSGPQHQATFEYRCRALGAVVTAAARSKKEAKQEAARLMLRALAAKGQPVPHPYGLQGAGGIGSGSAAGAGGAAGAGAGAGEAGGGAGAGGSRSHVALLQELCSEYKLAAPEYELVGDEGPPHLRHFTVMARVASVERRATATTKKAARQNAAEQVYTYLRDNLARLTSDFVEEDALVRAHEKAMERFLETRDDARRPDLGQKIADYHLGLVTHHDADRCSAAQHALQGEGAAGGADADADAGSSVEELQAALAALGLRADADTLPCVGGAGAGAMHVLTVDAQPQLVFAGASPADARAAAARYLRRALRQHPPPPPPPPRATTA